MERASSLTPPHGPYELPKYEGFSFTGCAAASVDTTGQTRSHRLRGCRLIRMQDAPRSPHRRRTISIAKRASPTELTLRYVGP
jgi:hypothetical protein